MWTQRGVLCWLAERNLAILRPHLYNRSCIDGRTDGEARPVSLLTVLGHVAHRRFYVSGVCVLALFISGVLF